MSEATAKPYSGDPYKTMCIVKHEGKEVGRIAATAPGAPEYIDALARQYGSLTVSYIDDENAGLNAALSEPRN